MNAIPLEQLTEQIYLNKKKFRLVEISKIENYFIEEINKKKSFCQKLSKYVTTFGYIDKILIVLSATTGGVSITSFTSIIGIASASFTLIFFLTTRLIKKLLNITTKQKEKG